MKQIQNNWQEVELGEICEVKKGSTITKNTIIEGDIPVIAGGQQPAYYHNTPNRTGETLTVSGSGAYAGFVAYFNIPIFASDCSTIQTKSKEAFMRYIYYFLKGNQEQIYEMQKGIAQPHVYPKDLAVIKIPLPSLQVQKQIVSILEKTEALKQKREDADKLTKEYLQSVFFEMFLRERFEEKELNEICEFIDYRGKTPKKTKSGIKLITAKNVKRGYIDNNPEEFIAESDYESWMTRGFPKQGDVLFTTEAPLGNVAVLGYFDKIALAQRIITLQCNGEINPFYLMYFLLTSNFQNKLKKDTTGSTVSGIRSKEFKKIKIPLPPLELQQKFASIVEHVEKFKEKQKQSKEKINDMFDSLMQSAFKGELVR